MRTPGVVGRLRESELGGLAGDSWHVAIWQGAVSAADLAQIALITHALGLTEYGRFALVVAFVVLVGQFFDVRVGTAATTFGAPKLKQHVPSAAGIFQISYLIDLATGILGFAAVAALAPLAGPYLVGEGGMSLIVLYALTLLASTVDESSLTVLRLLDRFRLVAVLAVALEVLRVCLIVGALLLFETLTAVILALLVYECFAGVMNFVAASLVFRHASGGTPLTRPALAGVRDDRRAMLGMIMHTNVVSYARLAQTQLPTIVVGALVGATQAGVYKVGMAAATIIGRVADPAYAALLPRLSRLWAMGRRREVRRLIGRATLVSIPTMSLVLLAVIILRDPILRLIGGPQSGAAASSVLILGGFAQAVNGALFWNIGVLFVAARSRAVSQIALLGLILQLVLLFPLVLSLDAAGAALALLASMLVTNLLTAWLAFQALDVSFTRLIRRKPPARAADG